MPNIKLNDELRVVLDNYLREDPKTCHVKWFEGEGVVQCSNRPSWCMVRASDGVHRPVCDEHKREIYDVEATESVLIPRCEACSGV